MFPSSHLFSINVLSHPLLVCLRILALNMTNLIVAFVLEEVVAALDWVDLLEG